MFKTAQCFFTENDEQEVSQALLQTFPSLKFVDGQHWPSAEPPLAVGIHQCKSGLAYLWPSDLVPKLPFRELPPSMQYGDVKFHGPSAGPVIQFCRCRKKRGVLEVGQLSATIQDIHPLPPLGKWLGKVVAFLKRRYRCGLDCHSASGTVLSKNLRGYLVGKSIQEDPAKAPRLVLGIGRDEYLLPTS